MYLFLQVANSTSSLLLLLLLLLDFFLETIVILSAILLPIKSPVAYAVFCIALLEAVFITPSEILRTKTKTHGEITTHCKFYVGFNYPLEIALAISSISPPREIPYTQPPLLVVFFFWNCPIDHSSFAFPLGIGAHMYKFLDTANHICKMRMQILNYCTCPDTV